MSVLIDCHAHLHDSAFDADRNEVIARAIAAGVGVIVTAGTDVVTSAAAVALAESEPAVYATVGIHPHDAATAQPGDIERLEALAGSERVVAIGEIGLDYHYDHSPRETQRLRFAEQLELASTLELPVVIHSRDADADTFAILNAWLAGRRLGGRAEPFGVMHCYSYGPERAQAYAGLGFSLSIAGIVTYPKAADLQAVASELETGSIVVETDCPYLAPQSRRGRRNEPALVAETAGAIAALRGITQEQMSAELSTNARCLFRLPERNPVLHVSGDSQRGDVA